MVPLSQLVGFCESRYSCSVMRKCHILLHKPEAKSITGSPGDLLASLSSYLFAPVLTDTSMTSLYLFIFTSCFASASPSFPTMVEGSPVFEYFASGAASLDFYYPATETNTTLIDTITSLPFFNSLVPAHNMRVEFEDMPDQEEVRVVNGLNGDFWTATGEIARSIVHRISLENEQLYRPCTSSPARHVFDDLECEQPFWTNIIMFEYDAKRIFPAIRHAATVDNLSDMETAVNRREVAGGMWYMHMESQVIVYIDRRTGDYWVGEGEAARLLTDRFDEEIRQQGKENRRFGGIRG